MSLRVHELAKKLKISTAALKKYLADMDIKVKSHMSPLDDEVVKKIKSKFYDEVAATKQKEKRRTNIHNKISLANKRKKKSSQPRIIKTKPKKAPKKVKVFKEKKIKKAEPKVKLKPKAKTESKPKTRFKKEKHTKKGIGKKTEPEIVTTVPDSSVSEEKLKKAQKHERKKAKKDKYKKSKIKHLKKSERRKKKYYPSEEEEAKISKNIKKTLQSEKKKKYKRKQQEKSPKEQKIVLNEFTSVSELAKIMDVKAVDIIQQFFSMGKMVTKNQRLDKESLEMICDEFNFQVEFKKEYGSNILEESDEEKDIEKDEIRPPVVTVMGHVDHGKTSILDYIRNTNLIKNEAGQITQHIRAYQVKNNGNKITFIDTPGHKAFTAMRARGADITDIAVIVVAANEGVKQQTIEAIDHAKAAGVKIIVAINKIDLDTANVDRTINELSQQNIFLEGYGGDILWIECSAKTGEGIDELLENITLQAEMMELKSSSKIKAKGFVVEAEKDSQMGVLATVLLQEGTLEKGDMVVCGDSYGRIRKMLNDQGQELEKLKPSGVALIFGLNTVPKAGDKLNYAEDKKTARKVSSKRKKIRREREKYSSRVSMDNLFEKIQEKKINDLKIVLKGDTDGSIEALSDSLEKLGNEEVKISVIRKSTGGINEADIDLASASDAIIIGFQVRANNTVKKKAKEENVEIKIYQVIYKAIEDLKAALEGMLEPEIKEKELGSAYVKKVFKISNVGTVAGCFVDNGKMVYPSKVRLFRNDVKIYEGEMESLKHFSDDVKEVKAGSECGISIVGYSDIKEGDVIDSYKVLKIKKTL